MSTLSFRALPTAVVRHYQSGGLDANGQVPEKKISDGDGVPCRHCLTEVPSGEPYLVLAHRPFDAVQPYAEVGPIFVHARSCERHPDSDHLPAMFTEWPVLLMRGYGADERIVYGTGGVVGTGEIEERAKALFQDSNVRFLHLRSASNNCFQARIDRKA